MIDAFIEQRPALDRSRIDTNRADDTVLIVLDPLAIIDSDTFRWGDPPAHLLGEESRWARAGRRDRNQIRQRSDRPQVDR